MDINQVKIFSLHGFLGSPRDWQVLGEEGVSYAAPNLLEDNSELPIVPFTSWVSYFDTYCNKHKAEKNVLVGYSMGGRLALQALFWGAFKWDAAILISTHPGLSTEEERIKRLQQDQETQKQIIETPWKQLIAAWNALPVFAADPIQAKPHENDFSRESLAKSLDVWSLGRQPDFSPSIQQCSVPLLWVTGTLDTAYCQLATKVQFKHSSSAKATIDGWGHRCAWHRGKLFVDEVGAFLKSI